MCPPTPSLAPLPSPFPAFHDGSISWNPDARFVAVSPETAATPMYLGFEYTPPESFHDRYEFDSESVLVLATTGRILHANRAFRRAFNGDCETIDGFDLVELVHPYDYAECQAWMRRLRTEDGPDRQRLVLRTPAGLDLPVEISVTPRQGRNGAPYLHGVVRDLSEQARLAASSREAAEFFHLLSQNAPWGVFVTDLDGRLRFANRRWRELADLRHVPEPRGVWWQMVHPGDRERVLAQWESALQHGHEFVSGFRTNSQSGAPRWVRTRIARAFAGDGEATSFVGLIEDITHQRQAEEVQRAAHEQLERLVRERTLELEQANRDLTGLIYAVSHDLKAPLRGIARLADWFAEDHSPELSGHGSALLAKLQDRVRHLRTLIDGILDVSRVGRSAEPSVPVDLNRLLTEISGLIDLPEHIRLRLPEPLPTVTGVHRELHQLFQNLMENSAKFMDKPEGRITITSQRVGKGWQFTVSDNGPGIPARYHEKVFELFQRVGDTRGTPGAGIGLTLVKRIVETRGGTLELVSEEGVGTSFSFFWPDHPPLTGA